MNGALSGGAMSWSRFEAGCKTIWRVLASHWIVRSQISARMVAASLMREDFRGVYVEIVENGKSRRKNHKTTAQICANLVGSKPFNSLMETFDGS